MHADLIRRDRWSTLVSRAKHVLEQRSSRHVDRATDEGM